MGKASSSYYPEVRVLEQRFKMVHSMTRTGPGPGTSVRVNIPMLTLGLQPRAAGGCHEAVGCLQEENLVPAFGEFNL